MKHILPLLLRAKDFLSRYGGRLLLLVVLISSFSFLRACYYAKQVKEVLDQEPKVLTKKQARAIVKITDITLADAKKAEARGDSSLKVAIKKETALEKKRQKIDSLTNELHEIVLDTTTSPSAVRDYLAHYTPGTDSL